jgi:hypothetical protein
MVVPAGWATPELPDRAVTVTAVRAMVAFLPDGSDPNDRPVTA